MNPEQAGTDFSKAGRGRIAPDFMSGGDKNSPSRIATVDLQGFSTFKVPDPPKFRRGNFQPTPNREKVPFTGSSSDLSFCSNPDIRTSVDSSSIQSPDFSPILPKQDWNCFGKSSGLECFSFGDSFKTPSKRTSLSGNFAPPMIHFTPMQGNMTDILDQDEQEFMEEAIRDEEDPARILGTNFELKTFVMETPAIRKALQTQFNSSDVSPSLYFKSRAPPMGTLGCEGTPQKYTPFESPIVRPKSYR